MALEATLRQELQHALKSKRVFDVGVYRLLVAALQNRMIEKRAKGSLDPFTDDEVREVLKKEVKKRNEASVLFRQGGREDLAKNEEAEVVIIIKHFPAELGQSAVKAKVAELLSHTSYNTSQFGLAMKEVMAELKGHADASFVSACVKEFLAQEKKQGK